MLNREKHQLMMGQILKDIYTDTTIGPILGFKGGTCAYLFYQLPRFSVDLDFDLLVINEENKTLVFEKILAILSKYGKIKDQQIKRFTILVVLSYGDGDYNLKVEINIKKIVENIQDYYEPKEYLGILMLIVKKDYMFANKLAALTLRNQTAMRDLFDIHYFAKNHWDINAEAIAKRTDKTVKDYLNDCVSFIEKIKDNQIMTGLGELIDSEKEKDWVRNHLKTEAIFMLKNYLSVIK